MQIETVKLKDIVPYSKNAKLHPQSQIEHIKASIREFGMNDPIAIDENNVIIEGHGRYNALRQLGAETVECIRLTNLTSEQKKAYMLAHNKLTMDTDFDVSLLDSELQCIFDVDMSDFGFDLDFNGEKESGKQKHSHREVTFKKYNLDLIDSNRTEGFYQMPVIRKTTHIPSDLIGFNYCLTSKNTSAGLHCFIDDYQFERLWNDPMGYVEQILKFDCFLTPDFSLYLDMPMSMKIWNVFRSRLIGQVMQDAGVTVIPTISWAEPETFSFCFDGIEKGSVVAISTIGVKRSAESLAVWKSGTDEMIKRIEPSTILCYGGEVEHDYKGVPVVYFQNHITEKMSKKSYTNC